VDHDIARCVLFFVRNGAMSMDNLSEKAVLSVAEVASLCFLSRSRFHSLIRKLVFPPPVHSESCKRPYYTQDLAQKCVEIRRTGIGLNGQVVLFNRKPKKPGTKLKPTTPTAPQAHQELVEAVRSLGLSVTADAVGAALAKLYPGGIEKLDQGEVIRKLFLHLQGKK
jgi:hypothetical protein